MSADAVRPGIRVLVSLAAGAVAIWMNTLMLACADSFHLVTARGGLLTLMVKYSSEPIQQLGLPVLWARVGLPGVATYPFRLAFHVVVGMLMSLLYGIVFAPIMRGTALTKGALSGSCVWLLNASIVLPLIGQGFAGSAVLGFLGIAYFAIAHAAFFIILACLYERWIEQWAAARNSRATTAVY